MPAKTGKVNVGRVCIDSGNRTDVVEDLIIRDRRHLSEDGIVLPIIAINKLSGKVETAPEIVTRGFNAGEDGFMEGARRIVEDTLAALQRRRKSRLRRDQRKNPRRPKALHLQANPKTPADHAGNPGDLIGLCRAGHIRPSREGEAEHH